MTSTTFLRVIDDSYSLVPISVGEFAKLKVNGMKFTIQAYHVEGLGHVSVMRAKGFFGLMKMDTLMIVPDERDLPLYSYDRIQAMGNDTLIVELYDTLTQPLDLSLMSHIKAKFTGLDISEKVIEESKKTAEKLGYKNTH